MTKVKSSLGIKYPSFRNHSLKTSLQWLEGRQMDDNAENLWRIHNDLYDLKNFSTVHPGGKEWIELTKGTDITEAFETHHLRGIAESLLPNYYIKTVTTPRNSPFYFNENGFYRTLKKRVMELVPNLPEEPVNNSKRMADCLAISYFVLALLSAYCNSFKLGAIAGILLNLTAIAGHNFFHQKNNFRMYYFDLILLESKGWRISHAMSHHLFPNTINDMGILFVEPFLYYLPIHKSLTMKIVQYIINPFVISLNVFGNYAMRVTEIVIKRKGLEWMHLVPYFPLILMVLLNIGVKSSIFIFLWIQLIGGIGFGFVGINAAHHHPDIFHDGDTPRDEKELDWGIHQLDTVMDRRDVNRSHFLVLTLFGEHTLHHLFPTLDHGVLPLLYPVLLDTCKEFGVDWRLTSQWELIKGQFRQLGRSEPNLVPPGRKVLLES